MRPIRALLPIAAAAVLAAAPVRAADLDAAAAGKRAVNLSALQPMLIEQAAKAACFASLAGPTAANLGDIDRALGQLGKVQAGLRKGSEALGLVEEDDPRMLQALDRLDRAMQPLTAVLTSVVGSGGVSEQALRRITQLTGPAVAEATDAATRAERLHGQGSAVPLAVTLKISLGARQRVLSQTMSKQLCLIAKGIEVEANREALAENVRVFETTLDALIDGFDAFGLPPESNPEQRRKLEGVKGLWADVAPAFHGVIEGGEPTADDLRSIAWQEKMIFTQLDQAVFNYEEGAGG